jgi:hypothetical protein
MRHKQEEGELLKNSNLPNGNYINPFMKVSPINIILAIKFQYEFCRGHSNHSDPLLIYW